MKRNFLSVPLTRILVAAGSLAVLGAAALADEIPASAFWPMPTPPSGANPAAFPMPRVEWIARVQSEMNGTHGKHYDLLFDGDSITDFWQTTGKAVWAQYYGGRNAFDFGISADKVENVLWRLQQGEVDGINPKLVVLMIGTNNMGRDSVDNIAAGITTLLADYEKHCPNAHFLLLAIFPRSASAQDAVRAKIIAVNQKIAALASDRVTYLDIGKNFLQPDGTLTKDIMPDMLHPSAKGYQIWADAIEAVVNQYVPKAAK